MKIENFRAVNFRNLKTTEIIPNEQMNVICGENAQGKTNILEAIWLFTGAKSFRNSNENNFINFGKEKAVTNLDFIGKEIKNNAKIEFTEKRRAFLNGKPLKNPSLLAGNFNAVIFTPDDLSLIKDGPEKRRRFLDISIGQIYPQYIEILREYLRAVKQRNQIIKDLKYDKSIEIMLDVFEEKIAKNGEKIIKYREKYIEIISAFLPEIYFGLSGEKEKVQTEYIKNISSDLLFEKLKISRKEDIITGTTSAGPHRDDITFKINGIDARTFGSQGQKRSIALSLKLSGAEVINSKAGEYPVCLLDDVMSELDEGRQNYILNHIKDWQSFITCCDSASVNRLKQGKVFEIKDGAVL